VLAHELTHVLQQNPVSSPADTSAGLDDRPRVGTRFGASLQRWWVNGPETQARNTILCDGKGGIRVQLGFIGLADDVRCLQDCYEVHENSHKADALAADPDICKGKDDGSKLKYGIVAARNTPAEKTERNASEYKAYTAEINCIRPQLAKVGPVCREIMDKRIAQATEIRDKNFK
jgi:hypothetical protein